MRPGTTMASKVFHRICDRCSERFRCIAKTRPPKFCVPCMEIYRNEQRIKARDRTRRNRAEGPKPKRKLIPYAGYDGRGEWGE